MDAKAWRGWLAPFAELEDPRPRPNVLHRFEDILAIAILAVLCGAEGWVEVAQWGRCKHKWLKTFLPLPHGIPSHDTFGRVFAALAPTAFETCFLNWTAQLAKVSEGKLVAIDGKTLRRSFDTASQQSAIHMISAFCQQNHLVLGQLAVEAKTNESTALPKLLKLLDLNGATVTVDAMHCQKSTAKAIRKAGGDYLMQVKANQKSLHEDIELFFDEAIEHGWVHTGHAFNKTVEKDHGRIETRRCWSTWEVDWLNQRFNWPELNCIVCVEAKRELASQSSTERRDYLSSHDGHNAESLLAASRGHWAIENSLHWSLDVSFGEDQSRLRQGHAAENFSRLRRLALNLLKKDRTHKVGLKAKAKACGWNHDYLLKVLTQP